MGVEGPAISYLHEQGRMGRDMKVGNDPVDSYGSIKLAESGLGTCMYVTRCTQFFFLLWRGTSLLVLKR